MILSSTLRIEIICFYAERTREAPIVRKQFVLKDDIGFAGKDESCS